VELIKGILEKIDLREFWYQYASEWDGSNKNIKCPIAHFPDRHPNEDKNKSFKIYPCFGASCGIQGDVINFFAAHERITNAEAIKELGKKYGIKKNIKLKNYRTYEIYKAHEDLIKDEFVLNKLFNTRGISKDIIIKHKIGFDKGRLWAPVIKNDDVLNLNRHDIFREKRKYNEQPSLFEPDTPLYPFPYENIYKDNLIMCAGIPDTLFLLSLLKETGYNPLTFGGEGIFPPSYTNLVTDKKIYICYDNDRGGATGENKILTKIYDKCSFVNKVSFPSKYKDVGEWLITVNIDERKNSFIQRLEKSKLFEKPEEKEKEKHEQLNFDSIEDPTFFEKKIKVNITIVGIDSQPYIFPEEITINCTPVIGGKGSCSTCDNMSYNGSMKTKINPKSAIKFINITDARRASLLKNVAPINSNCKAASVNIDVNKEGVLYEISFTEVLGENSTSKSIKVGFVKTLNVRHNTAYTAYGFQTKLSGNQKMTYVFDRLVPHANQLDNFSFSPSVMQTLNLIFDKEETVEDRINRFTKDLMTNYVKMWDREDVIIAVNMCMFSALEFVFNKRKIRGWVELLLFGDSGTAKSLTVTPLMEHYKVGHTITGEAVTSAGLIGSMSRIGIGTRHLVWGALPANDRKMVFIDEIHDADASIIKNLTSLRSSGKAIKTVEMGTRETTARVRIIFAANPVKKKIKDETFPIQLIKQVFESQEDRARLDLVLILSDEEISIDVINRLDENDNNESDFDSALCNELITFVWSRKPEQIIFAIGVTEYILKKSANMIEEYTDRDIGIVHKSRYTEKLARLSVSVAAMCFSHIDYKDIIVKKEHVDYAIYFQRKIYNKPECNYDNLCGFNKDDNMENIEGTLSMIEKCPGKVLLTMSEFFAKKDFDAIAGSIQSGDVLFNELLCKRYIEKTRSGYSKTSLMAQLIKQAYLKGVFCKPTKEK